MITEHSCPDLSHLRRFLLGQDADEEAGVIENHLGCCPQCLAVVSELDASDDLVEAAQAQATTNHRPVQTVRVQGLILRLKDLYPSTTPFAAAAEDYARFLAPPQADDEIGRIGTYKIRKLLGMGGMGVVFLAEEIPLKRDVALKLLRPSLLGNAHARLRFQREALATANIVHDHIVPIYQVGEDRDVPFFAMPVLQGESLADRLAREGRLSADEVIHIGREVALGLAAAHAKGLVHRDLKPANIWLEPVALSTRARREDAVGHRRVRLLDFGLAQVADSQLQLTEIGMIIGTPAYMAPEQARGEVVDGRCDLFSLGSVLYAMAVGRPPFQGDGNLAILHSICADTPPALADVAPEFPDHLVALIEKLHNKDKADRPQSAQEVVDWLDECGTGAKPRRVGQRTPKGHRRRWLVAALVLLAMGGLTFGAAQIARLGMLLLDPLSGRVETARTSEAERINVPQAEDEDKPAPSPPALAVLVFDERGTGAKDLGTQVTDLLFAKLAAKDGMLLVDRVDLQKILKELELGLSGAVKSNSVARVGQLTGARLLLWGSVIQVDKRRYLLTKLVGAETGRIVGVSVDAPASDELGPLVGKLADKVADALAQRSEELLPKAVTLEARVAALKKQMGQGARPALWVWVPERAVATPRAPDPAAQTELVKLAKEVGFPVVDAEEGAKSSAAILVTGEGISEVGGRQGGLVTVKARLEVKAVERATGNVLAVDRQMVVAVDVTEQLAGKAALAEAAANIAERLLPKLVGKE